LSPQAHGPGAILDSTDDDDERVTGPLIVAAAGTGLLDGITSKPLEMIKLRQQILPAAAGGVATASAVRLDGALAAATATATATSTATAAAVTLPLRALPTASGPLRHLSDVAAALTQGWGGHHPATVASATASTAAVRMYHRRSLPFRTSRVLPFSQCLIFILSP